MGHGAKNGADSHVYLGAKRKIHPVVLRFWWEFLSLERLRVS